MESGGSTEGRAGAVTIGTRQPETTARDGNAATHREPGSAVEQVSSPARRSPLPTPFNPVENAVHEVERDATDALADQYRACAQHDEQSAWDRGRIVLAFRAAWKAAGRAEKPDAALARLVGKSAGKVCEEARASLAFETDRDRVTGWSHKAHVRALQLAAKIEQTREPMTCGKTAREWLRKFDGTVVPLSKVVAAMRDWGIEAGVIEPKKEPPYTARDFLKTVRAEYRRLDKAQQAEALAGLEAEIAVARVT